MGALVRKGCFEGCDVRSEVMTEHDSDKDDSTSYLNFRFCERASFLSSSLDFLV